MDWAELTPIGLFRWWIVCTNSGEAERGAVPGLQFPDSEESGCTIGFHNVLINVIRQLWDIIVEIK
jgi:hypothetical protein